MRLSRTLVAVVGFVATSGTASAALPLLQIDQSVIRRHVGEYLRGRPEKINELQAATGVKVGLSETGIVYERADDGTPKRLVWNYKVASDPTAEQKATLEQHLKNLLDDILGQGLGQGLVSSDDLGKFRQVYTFVGVPADSTPETLPIPTQAMPPDPMPLAKAWSWSWPSSYNGTVSHVGGFWYGRAPFGLCHRRPVILPPVGRFVSASFSSPQVAPLQSVYGVVALPAYPPPASPVDYATPREVLVRGQKPTDSARLYGAGYDAFWGGKYRTAREHLQAAVLLDDLNAAAWYYLALTNWAMGDEAAGSAAARYGSAAAVFAEIDRNDLARALSRVPTPARARLADSQREVWEPAVARAIVAGGPRMALNGHATPAAVVAASQP